MKHATLNTSDLKALRQSLRDFDFADVMNLLGWNSASGQRSVTADGQTFILKPIAQLGGVQIMEVSGGQDPDTLPLHATRRKVSDEVLKTAREHLLIFVNRDRTQSQWYWVKRALDGDKRRALPRTHTYVKGQPDDVFVSKLASLFVNLGDLNENGDLSVTEAARRLSSALDSEVVVKRFYNEFKTIREDFASQIRGIPDDRERAWYASVLLNRLMFIYFLQGKGFLGRPTPRSDGNRQYLQSHMASSKQRGHDLYYSEFLHALFFDAFAAPEAQRSPATEALVGQIPYLSGSLFLKHGIELKYPDIAIPDRAFAQVLDLFGRYTWNLSDQDKHAGGLDPDVLGHIFEKYINQKGFGAYYTRPEITEYLCEQTVRRLVLDRIKALRPGETHLHDSLGDALISADVELVRALLTGPQGLHTLSLVDPACGSGAFLVAALKTMLDIYSALMARIDVFHDEALLTWRDNLQGAHRSYHYNLKKKIITDNLYGVDLMEEAAEIAKLRLFLSLVSSANTLDDLEPLPNIDFNILTGNSLIGLLHVDERAYNAQHGGTRSAAMTPLLGVGTVTYQQIVDKRLALLTKYKQARHLSRQKLTALRDEIEQQRQEAYQTLNSLLHKQFHELGIKFEQVTWDAVKKKEGKSIKRTLTLADVIALKPFHWAFEFAEVMARGGFDAVIANPPWDVVKPNGKEFLEDFSNTVSKNKMTIKDFEKEKDKLLLDEAIRAEWLAYQSSFPYVSAFYRAAPQFSHQTSTVNGRKTGSDLNLYKLFLEQGFNLLRNGGECGIVIPSGVYTDLGAKGLRELLFSSTEMTGLFCFENRKTIFENVDSRFKFVVLSFRRGGHTTTFPAAFMRHDVGELQDFPGGIGMTLTVDAVKRLSPDSLSVMEFKSELDAHIAEKMLRFPLLGEQLDGVWNLKLTREFDMTNDSHLFHTQPAPGRLPLYQGGMIHQFRSDYALPQYWLDNNSALGELKTRDNGEYDYTSYRLGYRAVASSTNEFSMIAGIVPKNCFTGNSLITSQSGGQSPEEMIFVAAALNSFVCNWTIRQKVTTNINMFYVYQTPIPRLTSADPSFQPIVTAAAKLICTTPEFDDLAREAGLRNHTDGVTEDAGRAALRAELDARVAHLYGLSESEFTHILGTFPLVDEAVKDAALAEFRALA